MGLAAPAMAAPPPATAAQQYSDALARLTPLQRNAALRRAVLDSAEQCRRVVASAKQGQWRNLIMWTARCEISMDGKIRTDYGAYIGPDGTVQVRQCAQAKQLGLPLCTKFGS